MALSREEVLHLADIYHIYLSDDEVEVMREQLGSILEQFQVLSELETDDVAPTSHSVPLTTVMREDEPRPSYSPDQVLANAPDSYGQYFQVRTVLED
ncbi:MAG: Asp-tRNA(Asn)/Glu-tRNA(Gln) amidotransferase subunit GatC [Chloroflexota bacterium]|nr:Asp-tRNA(Asn)/Glu-tRNA(Gln) amidotransferase subunit GatC [Chloroflexota bacterium]